MFKKRNPLLFFLLNRNFRTFAPEMKSEELLLSQIGSPKDLRKLSVEQLPQVCDELRRRIIEECAVNPGHFASSLGAVELTVALHYVFNTPDDRLVWDVGHQAYGHKMLTGRLEQFHTNRRLGGIRPFPSPEESEYDTFACGHASNSISAALGMAVANNPSSRKVVAIIGDGAMSGGLAFEGLNNVSSTANNLLIVLNDNDMSIDRAVGGMEKYLLNLDTNATYNRLRFKASKWLGQRGYLTDRRKNRILRFNNALKSALTNQQNIFEGMNIRYFGPMDGHDVKEIVRVLRQIKNMRGPKLLHLHTTKGKGYEPAEKSQTLWHAPGKFDPDTGERITGDDGNLPPRFQDVFGKTLLELAERDERIVGITPAMPTGCSMSIMMEKMPERTFDVGIAEGHAVTFSGGLAKEGMRPFCNIYSAFAQRAYDNIIHDTALLRLPVVICLDRAGLVGEDGATHHGAFDMAALRPIPNAIISSPMDEHELRKLMFTASKQDSGPFVIRYPRGRGSIVDWRCPLEEVKIGTGRCLRKGQGARCKEQENSNLSPYKGVAVLSIGPIGKEVEKIEGNFAHYDMRFLKPLDENILQEVADTFDRIITIEDGVRTGGFGSAVLEWMSDHDYHPNIIRLGLPDHFVTHGTVSELRKLVGLDIESLAKVIIDNI